MLSAPSEPPAPDPRMEDYVVLELLGEGAMGSVQLVRRKHDGVRLALKSVTIRKASDRTLALNEVSILRRLGHPGVVRFEGSFTQGDSLYILMDYCDGGDLSTLLSEQRGANRRLPETYVRATLCQLADALAHCHGQKVVHRDVKSRQTSPTPRNIPLGHPHVTLSHSSYTHTTRFVSST